MYRVPLALVLMALPVASLAMQPPPLTAATAVWTEDGKVELSVTYEGSACEEPGEAAVVAGPDTTDVVTIPTSATSEVCTLQIVPVAYAGVIAVQPSTRTLPITILDFDGQPKATGTATIKAAPPGD